MQDITGLLAATASTEQISGDIEEKIGLIQGFLESFPQNAFNLGLRVAFALICFTVGMQIIKVIRKILKKSLRRGNADVGVVQFLDSLIKAVLYLMLIFIIASNFGLDATSVVAVIGSAGVAIGLALQGSLSNLAGGVLILLLKPFKVGDYIIEDNKKNEGTVIEIQIFYTKLLTADEKIVVLPNGTLANTSLTNFTSTYKRRLDMVVGISYKADLQKTKEILQKILLEENAVLKDQEQDVFVQNLGPSTLEMGARCFVKNEDYFGAKCRMLERIKIELDAEGIEIPCPQMRIFINGTE